MPYEFGGQGTQNAKSDSLMKYARLHRSAALHPVSKKRGSFKHEPDSLEWGLALSFLTGFRV